MVIKSPAGLFLRRAFSLIHIFTSSCTGVVASFRGRVRNLPSNKLGIKSLVAYAKKRNFACATGLLPRKAAIKRERGESPRQSRCCEPPFCEGATLRPLAIYRTQTLSAPAEAGKAVASGRRVRRPAGMPHVLPSTRGLGKEGEHHMRMRGTIQHTPTLT